MTPDKIDKAIARYNKLATRRSPNNPALDEIVEQLREVPEGQDNRVDLILMRPCAVLPDRGGLFAAAHSAELRADIEKVREGWFASQAVTNEAAATVAEAKVDEFLKWADQTTDYVTAMLEIYGAEMRDTLKDWKDIKGDLAL